MGDDFMFQLFGKYRDMALAVKNPCHLNMAACFIKLEQYEDAIMQCSIVSTLSYQIIDLECRPEMLLFGIGNFCAAHSAAMSHHSWIRY